MIREPIKNQPITTSNKPATQQPVATKAHGAVTVTCAVCKKPVNVPDGVEKDPHLVHKDCFKTLMDKRINFCSGCGKAFKWI